MENTKEDIRYKFANLLNEINIPQYDDLETQLQKYRCLNEFICNHIPTSLYRYRTLEDHNVQAFRNNYIPVTKPCNMGDIFDSQIAIDRDKVASAINRDFDSINIDNMSDALFNGRTVPHDMLKRLNPYTQALIKTNLHRLRGDISLRPLLNTVFEDVQKAAEQQVQTLENEAINILQHVRYIACFCEDVHRVKMWSDYAGKHTGYALEYNFKAQELLCRNKHPNCKNIQLKHPILPVIYNESYDATEFVLYILQNKLMASQSNNRTYLQFFDWLFYIKGYVYKADEYREEGEWRLLTQMEKADTYYLESGPYAKVFIPPVAVYFGSRIPSDMFNVLNEIAVEKGLQRYRMVDDPLSKTVKPILIH